MICEDHKKQPSLMLTLLNFRVSCASSLRFSPSGHRNPFSNRISTVQIKVVIQIDRGAAMARNDEYLLSDRRIPVAVIQFQVLLVQNDSAGDCFSAFMQNDGRILICSKALHSCVQDHSACAFAYDGRKHKQGVPEWNIQQVISRIHKEITSGLQFGIDSTARFDLRSACAAAGNGLNLNSVLQEVSFSQEY